MDLAPERESGTVTGNRRHEERNRRQQLRPVVLRSELVASVAPTRP